MEKNFVKTFVKNVVENNKVNVNYKYIIEWKESTRGIVCVEEVKCLKKKDVDELLKFLNIREDDEFLLYYEIDLVDENSGEVERLREYYNKNISKDYLKDYLDKEIVDENSGEVLMVKDII